MGPHSASSPLTVSSHCSTAQEAPVNVNGCVCVCVCVCVGGGGGGGGGG